MRATPRLFLLIALLLAVVGCGNEISTPHTDKDRLNKIAGVYEQGEFEEAITQLDEYVKYYPLDDLAWTILGNAHRDLGHGDLAEKAYDQALKINPRCVQAITGKGGLHRARGEYDKAMAAYEKAVEIDPKYAHAYSSMADIALKQEQDAQALQYAKKAYELDKTDPAIAAKLAVAYHYNGDFKKRDEMTAVAKRLGYENIATLKEIYAGEASIRD